MFNIRRQKGKDKALDPGAGGSYGETGLQQGSADPAGGSVQNENWLVRIVAYGISLAAGVCINVEAVLHTHDMGLLILAVGSVFFCALGLDQAYKAMISKSFGRAALATILMLACLPLNAYNAFTLKSETMALQGQNRAAAGVQQTTLQTEIATLQTLREAPAALSAGKSVGMVEAEIKGLKFDKIYARSGSCENITVQSSREFCDGLAKAEQQLAAAKRVDSLDQKLSNLRAKLREATTSVAIENPGAVRFAQLSGMDVESAALMQIIFTVLAQLGIEVIGPLILLLTFCTVGGAVVAQKRRSREPEVADPQPDPVVEEQAAVEPPAAEPQICEPVNRIAPEELPKAEDGLVADFVAARMVKAQGQNVPTTEVHQAYCQHCKTAGVEPLHITQFVPQIIALGFPKERVGKMCFVNAKLLPPVRLAVSQ